MKSVGIRQLRNHLSRYLRDVRAGDTILVTDRGEAVAELRPPGRLSELGDELPVALLQKARDGQLQLAVRRGPHVYPRLPRVAPDGTAQTLLDADRSER